MKKVALLLSFLLCAFFSFAQFPNNASVSNTITLYEVKGALLGGKSVMLPVIDTLNNPATIYKGALTLRPQDNLVYYSDGVYWHTFVTTNNGWIVDSIYVERPIAVKIGTSGASTGKQVIYFLKESGLIAGGIPVSTGCRTLLMPPSIYNINFNQYTSLSTNLTIDTSHATLNRTDRIVGDTFGIISVIKGTPSSLGLPPTYNPSSQFSLALVPIPAASGCTPPLTSIKTVYNEDLGVAGGEYDVTTEEAIAADPDNTDNPYNLTKDIFISTYVDSSQLVFTNTGLQDTVTSTSVLVLPTYLNVPLTNPIQVEFFLNTTSVSNNTVINSYLNALDTGQYQVAAIPFTAFGFSSNYFNKIVFTFRGWDTSGAAGLYFDYIQIQKGITYTSTSLTLTTNGTSGAATLIDNVLNIPIYTGGGGSTNLNIGSGYRLAVPGTNNIKTLFGGNGITLDSTTNTNAITISSASTLDTAFQWSVLDSLSTPPVTPATGDKYLVGTSPTGAFATHANEIATWGGASYTFQSATIGDLLYNASNSIVSKWTGAVWLRIGRALIHQGGDSYAAPIEIGSIDNNPLHFKFFDTVKAKLNGTTLSYGDFSGTVGTLHTDVGQNYVDFTIAGTTINRLTFNAGVFTPYTGGSANLLAAGKMASLNTALVTSGFVNSQYEALYLTGTGYPSTGAESVVLSNSYSADPKRIIVYGGATDNAPVSILKSSAGNLIVGGDYTTDQETAKFQVRSTTKASIPAPKMTAAQRIAIVGQVLAGNRVGGTLYTTGTYTSVALTGGLGTGAIATITVAGGEVTVVTITTVGKAYFVGDVLSANAADIGGTGSGFTFTLTSVSGTPGLMVFDTDSSSYFQWSGATWQNLYGVSGGGGSGTVTSFSAGNLSPLFTTSTATATTTPALSFALTNAAAFTLLGRGSGTGAPSYLSSIDSNWIPSLHSEAYYNTKYAAIGGGGGSYTFSTGLTDAASTITSNLSTGVSGGQTAIGGTASGNNLTLSSTSNATKGKILFGNSAYDEVNNRLGIGSASPTVDLDVVRSVAGLATIKINNQNAGATAQAVLQANSLTTTFYFAAVNASYAGYGALTAQDGYAYSSNGLTLMADNGSTGLIKFASGGSSEKARFDVTGRLGIGVTSPTAVLHLKAGTATANTAPLKFSSGTLLTTAEAGAVEFLTDAYYGTITTGAARRRLTQSIDNTLGTLGTATNDNATAGNVGEEVNAIQSTYTNYTTTATYQNVTSITLTAGDWDISAFMTYSSNSATITAASNAIFVISTTTASAAGATEGKNIAYVPQAALLGTSLFSESISPYRVSIAGSTTYYLNTQATFTLGNPQYVGGLRARRTR